MKRNLYLTCLVAIFICLVLAGGAGGNYRA